jgi:TrmH RNA methyltransferase
MSTPYPRRSDSRPAPRPAPRASEFVAPAGPVRLRGSSVGPREVSPVAPAPAPSRPDAGETPLPGSRSGPARDELKICGLAAVRARFARDPGSIQRLFFDHATGQRVGVICRVLAQTKKIYRQVEPAELEKVAGSIHHGGIVAVVAPPALRAPVAADLQAWVRGGETVLVLDRIGNAHNLGAIARSAAFFGVKQLIIPSHAGAARPSDAAHRVAEGGMEHLTVWLANDLVALARELAAAGFEVIGAATRGGRPEAGKKSSKPVAIVLGNEEQGLAPEIAAACTRLVTIPGSGKVESLNVSVAAALLMWELGVRRVQ